MNLSFTYLCILQYNYGGRALEGICLLERNLHPKNCKRYLVFYIFLTMDKVWTDEINRRTSVGNIPSFILSFSDGLWRDLRSSPDLYPVMLSHTYLLVKPSPDINMFYLCQYVKCLSLVMKLKDLIWWHNARYQNCRNIGRSFVGVCHNTGAVSPAPSVCVKFWSNVDTYKSGELQQCFLDQSSSPVRYMW